MAYKIGRNHSSVAYVYTLVITARLTSFLLRLSSSAGSSSAICQEEMSIACL